MEVEPERQRGIAIRCAGLLLARRARASPTPRSLRLHHARNPARTWPRTSRSRSDLGELARLQHLAEPLLLRVVVAGDQHQIVGGGLVELVAQLGDVAAEALDRLDAQMTRRLAAGAGQGADVDAGEADRAAETRSGPRKSPVTSGHAFEIVFALFVQIGRLDQDRPGLRRQIIGQVSALRGLLRRAAVHNFGGSRGDLDGLQVLHAALRLRRRRGGSIRCRRQGTRGDRGPRRRANRRRECRRAG